MMTEWGFNPASVAAAGTVVAALALIIAIIGAFASNRQSRKERTLQAFVVLSTDVRQRWEADWGKFLREELPKMSDEQKRSPEVLSKLDYILNWLDWMGLMLRLRLVDPELVLGTLRHMIIDILRESSYKIRMDIQDPDRGESWWANVMYLAGLSEISFDIAGNEWKEK